MEKVIHRNRKAMLRLRIFIVRTVAPLLIMWAVLHENEKLLAWAIVDLPKLLSEGEGVEDEWPKT